MKKQKKIVMQLGQTLLVKGKKDEKFWIAETGLVSRSEAHRIACQEYPNMEYRIEGRRVDATPIEYEREKKTDKKRVGTHQGGNK